MRRATLALLAFAACGPETTSFRTSDKGDGSERDGPPAAAYDVHAGSLAANVHVWSNGGYIGTSEEPMTHVGFEIRNTGRAPLAFDGDALQLSVFDKRGAALPPPAFTAVTPLGPARQLVAPGATLTLDTYFKLQVRPRMVDHMQIRWSLSSGDDRYLQSTGFARDDIYPVYEPPSGDNTPRS